jgi:hypothetical protein
MAAINARRILGNRIAPERLTRLTQRDRLAIEAAIVDAYIKGYSEGAVSAPSNAEFPGGAL